MEEAVRELGYRPNAAAQALVRGRPSLVAVVAADTTRYGYSMAIQGVEEEARRAGHGVAISVVDSEDAEVISRAVDLLLAQPLAGTVVVEFDPPSRALLDALPDHLPVVSVSPVTRPDGVPRVVLDDEQPGRRATEHLLALGHRTVHHVATPSAGRPLGRTGGWLAALEAAGAPVPAVEHAGWDPRSGYEAGLRLASDPLVTSILCGNDELAIGVLHALAVSGRRVPDDVSVVGFDGTAMSEFTSPPLTTVRQDFGALGRTAYRLLQDVIAGRQSREPQHIDAELVVRASSGPPPSAG